MVVCLQGARGTVLLLRSLLASATPIAGFASGAAGPGDDQMHYDPQRCTLTSGEEVSAPAATTWACALGVG